MKKQNGSCRDNCNHKGNCILQSIDANSWVQIDEQAIHQQYKKNQAILVQGNTANGIYCIHSGKVKVVMVNNEGKEIIMRIAGHGDILGQRAFFSNDIYYSSAVAIEESDIWFFKKDLVYKLLQTQPSIAIQLLVQLSQNVESADTHNSTLVHKNVRERLAGLLIQLNASYGVVNGERSRIDT